MVIGMSLLLSSQQLNTHYCLTEIGVEGGRKFPPESNEKKVNTGLPKNSVWTSARKLFAWTWLSLLKGSIIFLMQRLKSLFLEHIIVNEFSTFTFEPTVY